MKRGRSKLTWLSILSGAVLLGVIGCKTPYTVPPIEDIRLDELGVGDQIVIVFSGNPSAPADHQETIREDGHITPPLLGKDVMAAGKETGQLRQELQELYVPDYFQHLTVTVRIGQRYFFVGGDVRMPSMYPYNTDMTITKAIHAAGGFTEFANKKKVELRRRDGRTYLVNGKKALKDSSKDYPVYPGDSLFVHKRYY